jgi:16S rRNA (uracil1498-N3)-methyltransferase
VPITRIYQAVSLSLHSTIQLDEKASHHVARVLRAAVGDTLTLFDGKGGECHAVITSINKKTVDVKVEKIIDRDVESPINIILAQGISRGEKMDIIIQKAVELGVKKIIPVITARCNVRLDHEREEKRMQHWKSVIISACEQSGRNVIPDICLPMALSDCLSAVIADKKFVLSPHVSTKLVVDPLSANTSIVLLIGPEGGLSDAEVGAAMQQQYSPLNLGPRVLRTETAPIAAIAIFQALYGDM